MWSSEYDSFLRFLDALRLLLILNVDKSILIWVVKHAHEEIKRVARSNELALPTSQFCFRTNAYVINEYRKFPFYCV